MKIWNSSFLIFFLLLFFVGCNKSSIEKVDDINNIKWDKSLPYSFILFKGYTNEMFIDFNLYLTDSSRTKYFLFDTNADYSKIILSADKILSLCNYRGTETSYWYATNEKERSKSDDGNWSDGYFEYINMNLNYVFETNSLSQKKINKKSIFHKDIITKDHSECNVVKTLITDNYILYEINNGKKRHLYTSYRKIYIRKGDGGRVFITQETI